MQKQSWADQTAAEEEEEERRRQQPPQQQRSNTSSAPSPQPQQQHQQQQSSQRSQMVQDPRRNNNQQQQQSSSSYSQQSHSNQNQNQNRGNNSSGYGNNNNSNPSSSRYANNNSNQSAPRDNRSSNNNAQSSSSSGYSNNNNRGYDNNQRSNDRYDNNNNNNRRDNNNDRHSSSSSRNQQPQHAVDSTPRETGILSVIKDAFGFIRAAEREGELFFHFSDLPRDVPLPPAKGTEVSFRVASERDGRSRAVQLEILPKGTVEFEKVLAEGVRGVLVREMRGQASAQQLRGGKGRKMTLAESLQQGRTEAYGGKIQRLKDESKDAATDGATAAASDASSSSTTPATADAEVYEFSERDLSDANIILYEGDIISFDIFIEKKSSRKGATRLTLIEPNPKGRSRGKIVSIRDNAFGFIEVEKEEADEDDDVPQQQQQQYGNRFDRGQSSSYSGAASSTQLFFHFSEFIDPNYNPQVGDELSFRMDKSPAEGHKLSAQRIQVLPKGSLNSKEVSKETFQGTVTKEITYETIATEKSTPSAAADAAVDPTATSVGDADATSSAAAPTTPTPAPATSPPPAASSSSRSSAPTRKMIPGIITYVDPTGTSLELPFRPNDILQQDRRVASHVLKGDTASFHIVTIKRSSGVTKRACQVSVPQSGWSKLAREQGIVMTYRDGFGFVTSTSRAGDVFLHSAQVRGGVAAAAKADTQPQQKDGGRQEALYVGLEVEFNVIQETPGKLMAIRALTLAPGTVQFEEQLSFTLSGTVSRGIKRRAVNVNIPKAGTDSSSFSKNDLRRDQASGQATSKPDGKGEKGEVKDLTVIDGALGDVKLPDTLSFFDVDCAANASSNLDSSCLVIGDVVSLNVQRHKRTGKLSATKVTLTSMSKLGREQGCVTKLKENAGIGYLLTPTRLNPIAFFLKGVLTTSSSSSSSSSSSADTSAIKVGDCFEFNISEANTGSKREREQRGPAQHADETFAVRLTPLPAGSVELEKIDPTRIRGYILSVPEKTGGKNGKPVVEKPGQLVRLVAIRDITHVSTTRASILTHPASWLTEPVAPEAFKPSLAHPAAVPVVVAEKAPVTQAEQEKFAFTFNDLPGNSFLYKGDLLDFSVSERTGVHAGRRAVDIVLAPFVGTVEKVDANGGTISVFNPQAYHDSETFLFSMKDVLPAPSSSPSVDASSSSSSSSAPTSTELVAGDSVEFSGVTLDPAKKKRVARNIVKTKSTGRVTRPGVRRAPGTAIVYASRFAKGPDATIGFVAGWKGAQKRAAAASPTEASPSP